jgi:hypothetical protein
VGVRGNHSDFSARDAKDQKDEEKKTEHVVKLVLPDAAHDEEQLDEHGTKGEDACGA